ncbi:2,3-epoxybenzoyl-CoA dihydrolase [Yinghuangia seranimata]|uniref:2,3-epoxybenzoyl-CoA dihydrolase n=1 Tax=Yinghuangia seranimata TaxID=408067 RepID=UPI00248B5AC5|nr:2,3-epoxybenzoyl-CoA dihydrolase [Yinghuangia seranimata]MDI2130052.1 2,3-epoxybenzoyl-CoA dihydrolase [Yinghuangia seranimata]
MPPTPVRFDAHPDTYRHWTLSVDGAVARLTLDVDERGGLVEGYELKLNSYDLGVDIELYDALQRIRFEHPAVKAVVVGSAKEKVFCAGANIRMLAQSAHSWKVNFCKFTNETRNGMEDASAHSGIAFVAAVNGSAAGGGYELALACDEIVLIDDGSSAVSLPEVPLLGVLPGTGGLTRVVDKRGVRKDLADVFATKADGVRGKTAVDWKLVDATVPRSRFADAVAERAAAAAARSTRPDAAEGVALTPLVRDESDTRIAYTHVTVDLDRAARTATLTVGAPTTPAPVDPDAARREGAAFWPLAVTRELDDAILHLRTNENTLGTWILKTAGDADAVLAHDAFLAAHADDWFVNEVRHYLKRTLKRLDVTSRTLLALVEPGSCFVGPLLELALAADRQYMLDGVFEDAPDAAPAELRLSDANFGAYPMGNGLTRLRSRFHGDPAHVEALAKHLGEPLPAAEALALGLVTYAPDDIDYEDEVRIVVEERASLSPDALTGMEANHRFTGPETPETKIFGRLSAWQNWIFIRPNAAGPDGALRKYGTGQRADFDNERV